MSVGGVLVGGVWVGGVWVGSVWVGGAWEAAHFHMSIKPKLAETALLFCKVTDVPFLPKMKQNWKKHYEQQHTKDILRTTLSQWQLHIPIPSLVQRSLPFIVFPIPILYHWSIFGRNGTSVIL